MQMIDVMKRLAELDTGNPNVDSKALIQSKPMATVTNMDIVREGDAKLPQFVEPDLADLKALSGVKKIDECGMMPSSNTPASINVTAGSGQELSGILKDIMGLAGMVKPMGHDHDSERPLMGKPEMDDKIAMRAMLDSMNEPTDEGPIGKISGAGIGAMLGGPLGAAAGASMGDELTGKDEEQQEAYDNTPAKATDIPPSQEGAHEYNPNKGDHRERQAGLPRAMPASLEETLMKQWRSFMAEN